MIALTTNVAGNTVSFSNSTPVSTQAGGTGFSVEMFDGVSFWPQCLGAAESPKSSVSQSYFADKDLFASKHGMGIMGRELPGPTTRTTNSTATGRSMT